MNKYQFCRICNSKTKLRYTLEFDYLLMSKMEETQEIYRCKNCKTMETYPKYGNSELEKYYSTNYSAAVGKKGLLKFLQIFKYKLDSQKILKYSLGKETRIFDYGAGYGEFLGYLKQKEMQVFGLEPTKLAREFVLKQYGIALYSETAEEFKFRDKYDVVIMRHVLEHVSDPQKVLKEIFLNGLHDNSICMIKVPNGNSLERKLFGKYWSSLDIPRHRFHFSKISLQILLNEAGFKNADIKTEFVPLDLARTISSWFRNKLATKHKNFFKPQLLDTIFIIILTPLGLLISIVGGSRLVAIARKD
jgi:SAM-dependent methyltransferase